jgi:HNH endonuclease
VEPRITLDRAILARWNRLITKQQDGCWLVHTTNSSDGYSRWRYKPGSREFYCHVWAYLAFIGPIPDGMTVDHLCHSAAVERGECEGGVECPHRRCANPDHLELVTMSEQSLRQNHANRRKTECPKGHPLSGDNLIVWKDGKRRCRTCLGR